MSHPVQGWQEFKQEKRGKMSVAVTIILLYVVMRMLE
jgi:ABC-type microcin C transport system permease subunit YejE